MSLNTLFILDYECPLAIGQMERLLALDPLVA
jgi:hypothetical protein